jgi:hypothetical protein
MFVRYLEKKIAKEIITENLIIINAKVIVLEKYK